MYPIPYLDEVTAVAYHAVHDWVYLSNLEAALYIMWKVQEEHFFLKLLCIAAFKTIRLFKYLALRCRRKYFLFPDIIEWLTLLQTLVCLCWPKIKSGLNLIICVSSAFLEDVGTALPRKYHIPHICFYFQSSLLNPVRCTHQGNESTLLFHFWKWCRIL